MSVCHTLKSTSIVCSGRGFFSLSVPECKKSRCQGGAKAPTQCLPLTYTAFFVLYSARKGGKPLYIVYMFGFFLFCLYSVVGSMRGVCLSGTLRLSPLPVAPSTPPEGGQGGGFDWSVATHRSTRTHTERPEHRREEPKKKRGNTREEGRTHWERAESKEPPAHSSRGDFFF